MRRSTFALLLALAIVSPGFGQVIGVGGSGGPTTGAGSTGGQSVGGVGAGGGGVGGGGAGGGGASMGQGGGGFGGGFGAGGTNEFGISLGTADTGFVGQNQNAQQGAFVGANQATNNQGPGQGGQFGNVGGARGGAGGVGGGRGGQAGRGGQGQQPQQRQQPRNVRIKLTLSPAFAPAYRVVPAEQLQSRLTRQYQRIDSIQRDTGADLGLSRVFRNANVTVTATGRSVTLRGQVASEREKSLAGRIARLEPGVDRVENQLVVAP